MSLSYEESDIFFEQRGEVSGSGSQVGEILATYVIAFLRHWANAYIWAVGWPMSF